MATQNEILKAEDLASLVDSGDRQKLRLLLNEEHPADLAEQLAQMNNSYRLSCFRLLDLDNSSEVLAELEPEVQAELLHELGDSGIVPIIAKMPSDEAVDLLSELPEEKAKAIISQMSVDEAEDIEELMSFKEDSAGGIMSLDYLAVNAKMTIEQALSRLRQTYEKFEEDIYDVYVVNEQNHLVGVVSVKDLLTEQPNALVEACMDVDVAKVTTDEDQEKAAEKLSRYDLLTLPVIDRDGTLRGIITADDAIDVLHEEATEDMYQSSGISSDSNEPSEIITYSVPHAFKARLPWLVIVIVIETLSSIVINHFSNIIKETVIAISFMPLLSAVTGSVATQSICIVLHGSTSCDINWKVAARALGHELRVGVLLGLSCAMLTFLVSIFFHSVSPNLGFVIGISLLATMIVGIITGTLMPLVFQKIGIDPVHASGPFITSLLDVGTFTIYLTIVHSLLMSIR